MYEKPKTSQEFIWDSPTDLSFVGVDGWEHGLQVRVPSNYNRNFTLKLMPKRYGDKQNVDPVGALIPLNKDRIVVDSYIASLSDNSTDEFNLFNSRSSVDSKVNIFQPELTSLRAMDAKYFNNKNTKEFIDFSLFNRKAMDLALAEFIRKSNTLESWTEEDIAAVNSNAIKQSILPEISSEISRLRTLCGDYQSPSNLFDMIRNRLFSGELSSFDLEYIRDLYKHQQEQDRENSIYYVVPSTLRVVNEKFCLSYMQHLFKSLNPESYEENNERNITKLIRHVAIDLGKSVRVTTGGEQKLLPVTSTEGIIINKDNTESLLLIEDGDYIDVSSKLPLRMPLQTEKDHAYRLLSKDQERILTLLGVKDEVRLTVKTPYSSAVEYTNSLNLDGDDNRKDYYVLQLDTNNIGAEQQFGTFVTKSVVNYKLLSDSDTEDWIKYKNNFAVYFLEHDDLFLDHLESSKELEMERKDISLGSLGPITNKDIPIIPRDIPWYVIIIPSSKTKYNPFKVRSHISGLSINGDLSRSISMAQTMDSRIVGAATDFINSDTVGSSQKNIEGETAGAGYINSFDSTKNIYSDGYSSNQNGEVDKTRFKSVIRKMAEIVTELNNNYILDGGLTWFDIISRLDINEYATLYNLENATRFCREIARGLIGEVKVFHNFSKDTEISEHKTRLKLKRDDNVQDLYFGIKQHTVEGNSGKIIIPPTTTEGPSTGFVSNTYSEVTFGAAKKKTTAEDTSSIEVIIQDRSDVLTPMP